MGITERTAEAERVELLSLRARVAELEQAIKVQASAVRSLDASRAARDAFETRTLRSLAGQERADLLRQIDAVREEATTWNARATELEAIIAGRTTVPTVAEVEAHGGQWVFGNGGGARLISYDSARSYARHAGGESGTETWHPVDSHGVPCAWPVAP